MTFAEAIKTCFDRYTDFRGCASRPEFWWWMLWVVAASIALSFADHMLSTAFALATLVPTLSVTARRLHDTNRSGWFQLLALIPVLGYLVLLIWLSQASVPNSRYRQLSI